MITRKRAVEIAFSWHGGMSSPLYSFASTNGTIHGESHRNRLTQEIIECLRDACSRDYRELNALYRHIESRVINISWDVEGDYGYGDGHETLTSEYNRLSAHNQLRTYSQNDKHVRSLRIRIRHNRIDAE